ncbi:MAG: hypothetical protein MUP81_02905 [Dehalococcoidia bacterium]|nr:hypothetical protein [Dehalococcoidia bacterium]
MGAWLYPASSPPVTATNARDNLVDALDGTGRRLVKMSWRAKGEIGEGVATSRFRK